MEHYAHYTDLMCLPTDANTTTATDTTTTNNNDADNNTNSNGVNDIILMILIKIRRTGRIKQPRKRTRPCAAAFIGSIVLPLVQSQLRSDSSEHNADVVSI